MVAQRTAQPHPNPAPPVAAAAPAHTAAARATPLLPVLALMNGSALVALIVLVLRPSALGMLQQIIMLLAMWLLVNLLVIVLVRMIDSGRTGTARVGVTPREASVSVSVGVENKSAAPGPKLIASPSDRMKS